MPILTEYLVKILINEAFRYRKAIIVAFVTVLLTLTCVGLIWPKGYAVNTTIVVDERNIIQPLMQGTAVATEITDRARLARDIINGRKIMNQILADTGWLVSNHSPEEQEEIIKRLTARTSITNLGRNLIKIEYRDSDPDRAYKTTARFAELFISESLAGKAAESQAAFDFIDKQVTEYHEKLTQAEEALKNFRSANLDAQPGTDADISTRLNALQTRIEEAGRELREAEIKKASLEKQLSGEAETASAVSRESQYRARIADLQSQLETLRLSYHDTYPDVVRLRHQIEDLKQAIELDQRQREQARASGHTVIDDSVINNPMYQQLRREVSATKVQIDTLTARIAQARQQLQAELERGKRVQGGAAKLAELTRDYQVNRDIYQDLLRRRENARVSMNLDKENQGLTFKIQEPATRPLQPTGPRFWHFVLAGGFLGLLLPLGLLYAKLHVDGRLRLASLVADRHKLPVLATVPHLWSPTAAVSVRREVQWLTLLAGSAILLVSALGILRFIKGV